MSSPNIDWGRVKTLFELAPLLSTSQEQLQEFLADKEALFDRALAFKPAGRARLISAVKNDGFRHFLKNLKKILDEFYFPLAPTTVHGFLRGRSIVTNAAQHTQKRLVLNVDVRKFYDSITKEAIKSIFRKMDFNDELSELLAELTTVDGVLATGFATSPVLSNLICIKMDEELNALAAIHNATYTRYADDLTFSGENIPPKSGIATILESFNFFINQDKYRLFRRGGPQYVTGLTVVDERPRLPRQLKRLLRLELYYIRKYGFTSHFTAGTKRAMRGSELPSKFSRLIFHGYGVEGYIAFVHSIEPKLAATMNNVLRKPGVYKL